MKQALRVFGHLHLKLAPDQRAVQLSNQHAFNIGQSESSLFALPLEPLFRPRVIDRVLQSDDPCLLEDFVAG